MEHYTNTSNDQMFQHIHRRQRRHRGGPQGAGAAKCKFAYGRQKSLSDSPQHDRSAPVETLMY